MLSTKERNVLRKFLECAGIEVHRKPDDFLLDRYPDDGSKAYYNVGSGSFWHPRWTNIDFVSEHYRAVQRDVVHHDLMSLRPLPISEGSARIIYTSHTIEHVSDAAVANLFEEAYRCLKPGGLFRVTTGPDSDSDYAALMRGDAAWFYWDRWYSKPGTYEDTYFAPADSPPLEERWLAHVASQLAPNNRSKSQKFRAPEIRVILQTRSKEDALDFFTSLCRFDPARPGNHISWWNADKIARLMRASGFTNVYHSGHSQSASPLMRNSRLFDTTHPQMSVYVEAVR
jgi:SAM-dependent methyltransferase